MTAADGFYIRRRDGNTFGSNEMKVVHIDAAAGVVVVSLEDPEERTYRRITKVWPLDEVEFREARPWTPPEVRREFISGLAVTVRRGMGYHGDSEWVGERQEPDRFERLPIIGLYYEGRGGFGERSPKGVIWPNGQEEELDYRRLTNVSTDPFLDPALAYGDPEQRKKWDEHPGHAPGAPCERAKREVAIKGSWVCPGPEKKT